MRDDPVSNIQFVRLIQKYPCLYNRNLPDYAKADNCHRAWEEIAEEMQETVETCKERWRNIRTVFLRSLKTRVTESGTRNKKPYYLSESLKFLLPFLRPSKPKAMLDDMLENSEMASFDDTQDYVEEDNDDSESNKDIKLFVNFDEQEQPELPAMFEENTDFMNVTLDKIAAEERPSKRTRLDNFGNNFRKKLTTSLDTNTLTQHEARKLFLLSLLPEVQKLSDSKMRTFRKRVIALIDELYEGNESN